MNLLEEHAREVTGMPPEWRAYLFASVGDRDRPLFQVRGAVAPLITKGKRKGETNWRKADKSTDREMLVTPADHEAWCERWEKTHDACRQCTGSGKVMSQWSVLDGITYKVCPRCNGTGKPFPA